MWLCYLVTITLVHLWLRGWKWPLTRLSDLSALPVYPGSLQRVPLKDGITLLFKHFNSCPSCWHRNIVLTMRKAQYLWHHFFHSPPALQPHFTNYSSHIGLLQSSVLGFCNSVEVSFSFFPLFFFSLFKKSVIIFSTFIPLFAFLAVIFPLQLIFNVYKCVFVCIQSQFLLLL